jgi:phosphohistidine phosphatase
MLMQNEGLTPDLILSSTAKRAQQTAKIVADFCGYEDKIIFDRSLYHGYSEDFIEIIDSLISDINIIMLVGHNPGLEEFLNYLTEENEWLPTAALAQIELDIHEWAEIEEDSKGELVNIWRPRDLS